MYLPKGTLIFLDPAEGGNIEAEDWEFVGTATTFIESELEEFKDNIKAIIDHKSLVPFDMLLFRKRRG